MAETTALDKSTQELIERIRLTGSLFARDLKASTEEMLSVKPAGKARTGFDIAYEVTWFNGMVAAKINGDPIEPMASGWVQAPESFNVKSEAVAAFKNSVERVCDALPTLTTERYNELVDTPFGPMPLIRVAGIIPMHQMYHSGQLNYIQTLHGDDESHW